MSLGFVILKMGPKQKGKGKKTSKGDGAKTGGGRRGPRYVEPKDGFVEIIFVDRVMRYFKMLKSANDRIPETFLSDILDKCSQEWISYLPRKIVPKLFKVFYLF